MLVALAAVDLAYAAFGLLVSAKVQSSSFLLVFCLEDAVMAQVPAFLMAGK
jgi:hypothetical protein